MSVGSQRQATLAALEAQRRSIASSTSGQDVRDRLARTRQEIIASTNPGRIAPQTIVRNVPVDTDAIASRKDPIARALEARYQQRVAAAQSQANAASMTPWADVIYGSPQQSLARQNRADMMRRAAEEYNAGLAPNDPRRKDPMVSIRYGA